MYGEIYIHNFTNYGLPKFLFVTLCLTRKKNRCLRFSVFCFMLPCFQHRPCSDVILVCNLMQDIPMCY